MPGLANFGEGIPTADASSEGSATEPVNEWEAHYISAVATSLALGQHYFVTADKKLLRERNQDGLTLGRPGLRIQSVNEALACAGAIMRIHGATFWDAAPNSNLAVSNFTFYSKLAVGSLPNRVRFHKLWIKGSSRSDDDFGMASELEQSLHYRAADLFRARDLSGREDLRDQTAATVDSVLYHLRAAIAAAAASFDSMAKLSAIALGVPAERRAVATEIGFGHNGFRKSLSEFGGAGLVESARTAAPVLNVVKAFRDPMIHHSGLAGSPLYYLGGEKPSEGRADITPTQRIALDGLGKRSGRPQAWGLRTWGDHAMIDPARFTGRLAIEAVALLDELLRCLSNDLQLPDPPFDAIDALMLQRLRKLAALG